MTAAVRFLVGPVLIVLAALAVQAPPAAAAIRYAAPTSSVTTGCTIEVPCRLVEAVSGAAAGDEIIALPGTYTVDARIDVIGGKYLHGAAGQPRPVIRGATAHVLRVQGDTNSRISDLEVEATAGGTAALDLRRGTAERVRAFSAAANAAGAELRVDAVGALLRDSVVTSATGPAIRSVGASGEFPATTLLNVTAVGGTYGLYHDGEDLPVAAHNSIFDGPTSDVHLNRSDASLSISSSSFGPVTGQTGSNYMPGPGNRTAAPVFVDRAAGDLRQDPSSPTVDAGTTHARLGTTDLDGATRTWGSAVDIGAYELGSAAPPSATTAPSLPASGVDGETVTCQPGTWSNASTFAYGWTRDGATIDGETSASLTLTAADRGAAVRCVVTATGPGGTASATSDPMPVTAPAPAGVDAPSLPAGLTAGDVATCDPGTWTDATAYAYAWSLDGVTIPGETAATYTSAQADEGGYLRCEVTASGPGGSTAALSNAVLLAGTAPSDGSEPSDGSDPSDESESSDGSDASTETVLPTLPPAAELEAPPAPAAATPSPARPRGDGRESEPRGPVVPTSRPLPIGKDNRIPLTFSCPVDSPADCAGSYSISVSVPARKSRRGKRARSAVKRRSSVERLTVVSGAFSVKPGETRTIRALARNGRIRAIRKRKGRCRLKVTTFSFGKPVTQTKTIKLVTPRRKRSS